ncbi:repressor LexA [Aliifodinibius salicampi]|uniref:Repressor LexA n=1 Tax=Fodinibius salicampi TaxID=1920655 RepID=A0ABT3Q0X7_9BACT|nr:S24 family peptidase [Fodinibius salicampi]MCW9713768.1 repressor LexA [Fodinibius salicampi]
MEYPKLTNKQNDFFNFLVRYVREFEQWPSHQDLMDEFGFKSPRSITQLYEALIKKNHLVKADWGEYDFHPVQKFNLSENEEDEEYGIPIVGLITAGGMQEAVEEDLGRVTLKSILPNYDKMKAVVVSGQSMRGAGINNGDIVLLAQTDIFDGDIGAVRYRGETSLKRIYSTPNGMRLKPANEDFEPITIEPGEFEEVNIIGKYVGHINDKGLHKV